MIMKAPENGFKEQDCDEIILSHNLNPSMTISFLSTFIHPFFVVRNSIQFLGNRKENIG